MAIHYANFILAVTHKQIFLAAYVPLLTPEGCDWMGTRLLEHRARLVKSKVLVPTQPQQHKLISLFFSIELT